MTTLRAFLGILSSPPCMAFLALIKARPSICSANATNTITKRASCQAPRTDAPTTANDVRTLYPSCPDLTDAHASENIFRPPIKTPVKPTAALIFVETDNNSIITMRMKIGIATPAPINRH
ncbi:MAG: hypothetical protein CMP10_12725 [Zetaproteobacteria bacterium]|nr:hypothetical protein [Pseudobdellovibrionaceae bacterium]